MGLSAYWEIPDLDNLSRLLQRMGVKWLRNGDTANFPSIWAMFHNNVNWKRNGTNRCVKERFVLVLKNGLQWQ